MIKNLYIKNFAIIDEVNIQFEKGLTIITGETGAGKSILMGALSLVLGERADSGILNLQKDKCIIEANFEIAENDAAKKYLSDHDFDTDDNLIIRREIISSGKSRVFINDTPATLAVLSPLSHLLLDLHRQFETGELQQVTHQLAILDDIASHKQLLSTYEQTYQNWKKAEKEYNALVIKNKQIKHELDYNSFTFQEIDALALKENEIEQIESELILLENAEAFKQSMQSAMLLLNDSETPVIAGIKQVVQSLEIQSKINPAVQALSARLSSSLIEIKDIHAEIESEYERAFYDEEKIALLHEKLNEANRLLKKHHVKTTDALLQIRTELEEKIMQAQTADDEEAALAAQSADFYKQSKELAAKISVNRKAQQSPITQTMNSLLKRVGMPNAVFTMDIEEAPISKTGTDKVEFLFDSNKTGQFKPIAKVASGGELSRLMLCIKSMVAETTALPTLIFDEIDTGISGETAIQVGNIMKQLSGKHQLISITHLPQIAGKANQHLYIYKKENNSGQINTYIKKLSDDERVDILAEMLSGKESSESAKEMVKELMR
ncbi:MAG: DNA repair protein RecN [Chitinophagaceae bacterium]|nr:DNA repair protein RecN [Chitinophagaceae bacterium]